MKLRSTRSWSSENQHVPCEKQSPEHHGSGHEPVIGNGETPASANRILVGLLHLGFAFSGMMVVLLGAILPRFTGQIHQRDAQAGVLMLLQFWGSAAGALFVRSSPWKALQRGFALQLVAALGIYLVPVHWLFLCFGMLGLSLGMIMTATSILVARIFFQRKGSALAILNVFWGLGAMLCPAIVSRVPAGVSFRTVYTPAFVISIFFLIAFSGAHRVLAVHIQTLPHHDSASVRRIIVQSSLLAFLYVGVESSLGNWISTYSHRHFSLPFAQSALSLTCFWAFLLAGRLLTPLLLKRISEASLSLIATWVTAVSVCFTVFVHSDLLYIALISIAGLSLAPIYPLILSSLLTRAEGSPYTGWVFTMAGCGGGLLSWLSGEVSSSFGSLRIGLFVPTVAALFLAVFTLFFSQQEAPLAH